MQLNFQIAQGYATALEEPRSGVFKKELRTMLLNLPHETRIVRRYMCTYSAPNFLFPPQELIALGGILKEWKKAEVHLLDAIAEGASLEVVCDKIGEVEPDIIVTITGFESFESDMNQVAGIKERFPNVTVVAFGHYATQFPQEILEKVPIDYIILGEPDLTFSELYDHLRLRKNLSEIKGIAYRNDQGDIILQPSAGRIPNPNLLPVPAYDLLNEDSYFEPFLPKPFGMIQTARGCPYQCNYCVKSYGTKLTMLTPERIIYEIKYLIEQFGIKSLRFIDDTFTAVPKRVIDLCTLMIENKINIKWTCLSRADTINEEMLGWMKKAGCVRIYFGIESGSQRILDYLNKGIDIEASIGNLRLTRQYGIETAGWFIFGHPIETQDDFEKTVSYAIRANLHFLMVGELTTYPGTELYESLKDQVDFSILPYRNEFKDKEMKRKYKEQETNFYKRFYFRPGYLFNNLRMLLTNSREITGVAFNLLGYMWANKHFMMPNYKEVHETEELKTFAPYSR